MGKIAKILLLTLVVVSCGTDGQHFSLNGRLLHFNQGEFYVYTPDGDRPGIDTMKVEAGRFSYEIPCRRPMTLMIVFPNFTEQPVFAEPGKSVKVEGSASNLKELKITGTADNKLMNTFRESIVSASPPEIKRLARQFIIDHPASRVGSYLVRKYFIQTQSPDYATADTLLSLMVAQQEDKGYLRQLQQHIHKRSEVVKGKKVPAFTAHDINGKLVSNATLSERKTAVVCLWASWNYESISMLRRLESKLKEKQDRFTLLSICADPSLYDCRRAMRTNNINSRVVCDGDLFDGSLVRLFGLSFTPDNVLIKDGKIVERGLNADDLIKRLNEL